MATPAKKTKYKTKFSDDLKTKFPFVSKCSSSIADYQYKFHCNVCNLNLSCAAGGANDITKHAETPNHKKNEKASKSKFILFLRVVMQLKD